MTVIKQYCDHCGKELDGEADYTDAEIDLASGSFLTVDLCASCFHNLKSYVFQYCKKEIWLQ